MAGVLKLSLLIHGTFLANPICKLSGIVLDHWVETLAAKEKPSGLKQHFREYILPSPRVFYCDFVASDPAEQD